MTTVKNKDISNKSAGILRSLTALSALFHFGTHEAGVFLMLDNLQQGIQRKLNLATAFWQMRDKPGIKSKPSKAAGPRPTAVQVCVCRVTYLQHARNHYDRRLAVGCLVPTLPEVRLPKEWRRP